MYRYNNYSINDIRVALSTMSLRSSRGRVSTVITVWKGDTIVITWDRLGKAMLFDPLPSYHHIELSEEDKEILTKMVADYLADPSVK